MRLARRNRSTSFIGGLMQAAGFLTALFSFATAFNGFHRYLELFSHFRLQYLGTAILLLILFLLLRYWRYALLMVATIALNAWYVAPWYLPQGTVPYSENRLKVLIANVNGANNEHFLLRSLVEVEQPDVLLVQEVSTAWAIALDEYDDYPYRYIVPRYDLFGIAILSRLPLDNAETIDSPPRGFPTLRARVTIGGRPINLITTHPTPPLGKQNYDARNVQLASLGDLVNESVGATLLAGDLNTTMWASNYVKLIDRTGLDNVQRGFGLVPSWPTFLPFAMIPIDHCLVTKELVASDVRRGPDIRSDHRPLIVTVQFRQAASAAPRS